MSSSLRARRMKRNHKRGAKAAKLNLVALMDIFTILVLFLMVNNGDVEVLQTDKTIVLPESVSEQKPELDLTIRISADHIVVLGRKIEDVVSALEQDDDILPGLDKELRYQASRAPALSEEEQKRGRSVIIMASSDMPYKLLKRVMTSCAKADYRDISLAVNSVPQEEEVL